VTEQFRVRTWGVADYALTPPIAQALQATGLVRVEVGGPLGHILRGLSYVGVAAGDGWELRVDSHLTIDEVMFLLTYARNPKGWKRTYAHFAEADSLFAAIAWGLAANAEAAIRAGVLRGYRREEERSPVVRGRIQFAAQAARGGLPLPVEVVRDEYDLDILENRMLLAATHLVRRLPLLAPEVRGRLGRVAALLAEATLVRDVRSLKLPRFTRLNRHYEPALVLADLLLRGLSISARSGQARSVTFRFELHRVFEDFLDVALRSALAKRGVELVRQPTHRTLDHQQRLGLEPDFVALRNGRPLGVLDAKFKRLESDLGGDAYQMLAYLLEFGCHSGVLVSAEGDVSEHDIRSVDKTLRVRPLGLNREPNAVLTAVDALADQICTGATSATVPTL
jgi:5-methylcytosine-specific restriction enzyme subunit McrC